MKWKKSGKDDTLNQNLDFSIPDGQTVPNESGGDSGTVLEKKDFPDKKNKKKRKVVFFLILLVIFCGILFYVFMYRKSDKSSSKKDMAETTTQTETNGKTANVVTASGTSRVGVVDEEINLKYLSTDLAIEKIYVNNNTAVKKGDKILKVTDDSVKSAKQELENALANAEIAYRAGVITEKESEIQAKYNYDSSTLAGQQAQDVYNATITTLQEAIDTAQKAIDDANSDITEYSDAVNKGTYDTKYNVTWLYNKYQNDVTLLKKKVSDWGLDWSQVTETSSSGSAGNSTYLSTARQLYTEVNTEYNDYKSAKSKYDDAMTTAKYGLQKLQLQMTSLQNALTTAKNNYTEQSVVAKDTYNQTVATAKIAKDTYNTAVKKAQEQLDTLAATKDTAQNNQNNFTSTVGDGYMYAPTNGTIMHVTAKVGNYLNSYTKVFVYSDSNIMTVSASVDQASIDKLDIGESAMVIISKYGNYTGKITSINPVSSSTSKSSITYTVTVTLEGDISTLKENQTAQVIFGVGGEKNETTETTTVSGNDVTGNDITGNNSTASKAD